MRMIAYILGGLFLGLALLTIGDIVEMSVSDHKQLMIGVCTGIMGAIFLGAGLIGSEMVSLGRELHNGPDGEHS